MLQTWSVYTASDESHLHLFRFNKIT